MKFSLCKMSCKKINRHIITMWSLSSERVYCRLQGSIFRSNNHNYPNLPDENNIFIGCFLLLPLRFDFVLPISSFFCHFLPFFMYSPPLLAKAIIPPPQRGGGEGGVSRPLESRTIWKQSGWPIS